MSIFREKEIAVGNRMISIKKKDITEIFQFGQPPYIIVGTTGSGKTKLSIALLYLYAKECTRIIYVSETKSSSFEIGENSDVAKIPKVFRRTATFESLNGIWNDIKNEHDAHLFNEQDYVRILKTLWVDEPDKINKDLQTLQQEFSKQLKEITAKYTSSGISAEEANSKASVDLTALRCDVLSKMILNSVEQKPKNTEKLTEKEMRVVSSIISPMPKSLIILDDVSAEMDKMQASSGRNVRFNGETLSVSKAYNALITDILTKGRHYNAIICLFLHSLDAIQKEKISNLVIFDQAAASKILLSKSIPKSVQQSLGAIIPVLFNGDYKYHFLYANTQDNDFCVGKADLYSGSIPISKINLRLAQAYEEIEKLTDSENVDNEVNESSSKDDDDEEDDEDDDEEDDEEGDTEFI